MVQLLLLVAVVMLVWATYTDVRSRFIPDAASLIIGLSALVGFGYVEMTGVVLDWIPTAGVLISGPVLGIGLLLITEFILDRIHASSPIEDAIGGGDIKLVGALGMWLGPQILIVLLIASIAAVLTVAFFSPESMVDRGERFTDSRVAYAPFLALGVVPVFIGSVWM